MRTAQRRMFSAANKSRSPGLRCKAKEMEVTCHAGHVHQASKLVCTEVNAHPMALSAFEEEVLASETGACDCASSAIVLMTALPGSHNSPVNMLKCTQCNFPRI
ncbi:hypothetical protein HaLaN_14093, partial [Haematococcus lacustris]